MVIEVITKEDLETFKTQLLNEFQKIMQGNQSSSRKWLKSNEVKGLLNISSGTLQNLRINGTLTYTKIGGTLYYDSEDINKLLNKNKTNAIPTLFV